MIIDVQPELEELQRMFDACDERFRVATAEWNQAREDRLQAALALGRFRQENT